MAVTLQQIAQAAGVSRGTVDRALNNRGRIRPEVAERIRKIAQEMGYQPSLAGRALVMAGKNLKIGVILQSSETPFMQQVLQGIQAAKQEVEALGVTVDIHEVEGVNAGAVITLMRNMMEEKVNGIALSSAEDQLLRQTINECVEELDIPVITFNSDLEGTKRICYVGQNGIRSGQAAAGLMEEILHSGEVAVISGYPTNPTLNDRAEGFRDELQMIRPDLYLLDTRYAYDDNWVSEKQTEELLEKNPNLGGIYITGSGTVGVCRALKKYKKEKKIKVIGNDFLEENLEWLKRGTINFLIGQDAYMQGYEPVMLLFHKIFEHQDPENEFHNTDIVIKMRYNL